MPTPCLSKTRDSKWRLREKATDFKSSLVRESLYKEKTNVFVVIEVGLAGDKQPLKRIAIYPDIKKYPNVAEELTFRDIAFDFAARTSCFPNTPR